MRSDEVSQHFRIYAMVIVAVFGAITSYYGALAQQEATIVERRLVQVQLLEVTFLNVAVARLDGALEAMQRAGDRAIANSTALAPADKNPNALQRELYLMTARLISYSADRDTNLDARSQYNLVARLNEELIGQMRVFGGFDLEPASNAAGSANALLQVSRRQVDRAQARVIWFGVTVTLFVASLVAIAMADPSKRRFRWAAAVAAGTCLVALALSAVLELELTVLQLVTLLVGVPSLYGIERLCARRIVPAAPAAATHRKTKAKPPGAGAADEPHHPAPDVAEIERPSWSFFFGHIEGSRFAHWAFIAIAYTVLFSAVAGLGYAVVERQIARAALDADGHEITASQLIAAVQLTRYMRRRSVQEALELRADEAFAMQIGAVQRLHDDEARLRLVPDAARTLAFIDDPHDGIDADPNFPSEQGQWEMTHAGPQAETAARLGAFEELARWDASDETLMAWHEVSSRLLESLTLFAIALFLFAQAHGVKSGAGSCSFLASGAMLVAFAFGLCGSTVVAIPKHPAVTAVPPACAHFPRSVFARSPTDAAGQLFAYGAVALTDRQWQAAVDDLQCAAAIRPSFRHAKVLWLGAMAQQIQSWQEQDRPADAPMLRNGLVQLLQLEQDLVAPQDKEVGDFEAQHRLEAGQLAFTLALAERDPGRFGEAERSLAAVVTAPDATQGPRASDRRSALLVLAIARLAGAALEAPQDPQGLRLSVKPLQQQLTQALDQWAHSAPSGIEPFYSLLKSASAACSPNGPLCSRLRALCLEAQERLVGAVFGTTESASRVAPVRTVNVAAYLDGLVWRGADNGPPGTVVIVWSAWDPALRSWNSVAIDRLSTTSQRDGTLQQLLRRADCLNPARMALDVYQNGRLVDHRDGTLSGPVTKRWRLPELNLEGCFEHDLRIVSVDSQARAEAPLMRVLGRSTTAPELILTTWYSDWSDASQTAGIPSDPVARLRELLPQLRPGRPVTRPFAATAPLNCQTHDPPGDLVWSRWKAKDGLVHLVAALPGERPWPDLCQMLSTVRDWSQ